MSIEAMKQALEALERGRSQIIGALVQRDQDEAITALRQAIAEAEKQEPMAWFIQYEYRHEFLWREPTAYEKNSALEIKPLYTSPVHASDISQERVDETAKHGHEPVAWREVAGKTTHYYDYNEQGRGEPLYAAPQPDLARVGEVGVWGDKREWVGFTHEELAWLNEALNLGGRFAVIEAIEAKLKEKNNG